MKKRKKNLRSITVFSSLPQTSKPTDLQLARHIAANFGEPDELVRQLIRHIIWALGTEQVTSFAFWASTYDPEREEGSWMTPEMRDLSMANIKPATLIQRPTEKSSIFFSLVYSVGKTKADRELQRPEWLGIVSAENIPTSHGFLTPKAGGES